jgi:hypothetical protein
MLRARAVHERTHNAYVAKSSDEIRIFCNCSARARASPMKKRRMHARQFSRLAGADRRYVHGKIFLHSSPHARVSRGRNRSKNAESVPSDSRVRAVLERQFLAHARQIPIMDSQTLVSCAHSAHASTNSHAFPSARAVDQSPSFFFRSSLTACGLALPPDAFIT